MQYISFYKNRLPFKPKTNVVIYFDVMSIHRKHRPYVVIDEVYDVIEEMFRRGGLELCFLPRIANRMELDKIYRLARTIKRSMQQVEYAPAMSADEAIAALRAL